MKPLTPPPFAPNGAAGLLAIGEDAHPAIVWHDGHVGYGALRDAVARAAAVWRAHGLRPGGRVAVRLPDGIDWVLAWLGAVWAGGVAVGVTPRLSPSEWRDLLEASRFDLVVTHAVFYLIGRKAAENARRLDAPAAR